MKKQLARIEILKTGIFLAALQAALGLVIAIPISLSMAAFAALVPKDPAMGHHPAFPLGMALGGISSLVMIIAIPIFYGIIGFIFGIFLAAIYNMIAKWTGGLEFEVRDLPPPLQ